MEVKILNSVEEYDRRQVVRNIIGARLLSGGPPSPETVEAFKKILIEALLEKRQLPQLLVMQSRMIH